MQIILVTTYLFYYLANTDRDDNSSTLNNVKVELSKNGVYILSLINFIILMMIHISLEFFSTDEAPVLRA